MRIEARLIWAILLLLLLVFAAAPAVAYLISYDYYAFATGSAGPVMDSDTRYGEWYVDGDYTVSGPAGNFGTAEFCADASAATVWMFAQSHGLQTGTYSFPSGTGRVEKCAFTDNLFFTVPPGTYTEGLYVSLLCRARGTISSGVGAGAMARLYAGFWIDVYETELMEVRVEDSGTINVDEDFTLTVALVSPGTTLSQATEYTRLVDFGIRRAHAWSTSYNPGGGSVIGDATVDFRYGIRAIAMVVPATVTWRSESGMFPDLPTSVEEPPRALNRLQLEQNYPNPFNPATTIRYRLPRAAVVDLHVYDAAGRRVVDLLDGEFRAEGPQSVDWGGRDDRGNALASGVYIYQLRADGLVESRPMVLLR